MDANLKKWIKHQVGIEKLDSINRSDIRLKLEITGHNLKYILKTSEGNSCWLNKNVKGQLIRFFVDSSIPEHQRKDYMDSACAGIKELIDELGLDFKYEFWGVESNTQEYIKNSLKDEKTVDPRKIAEQTEKERYKDPERGGIPHADVVITNKYLPQKRNGTRDDGWCDFSLSTIVLSYPYNPEYIKKLAKHEAVHMLGCNDHHKDIRNPSLYPKEVSKCAGNPSIKTSYLCLQCYDVLVAIWLHHEKKDRKPGDPFKYFRND